MKKCNACGTNNSSADTFCAGCGNKLPSEQTENIIYCSNCGTKADLSKMSFCQSCGQNLTAKAAPVQVSKANTKIMATILVVVLAIGSVTFIMYGKNFNSKCIPSWLSRTTTKDQVSSTNTQSTQIAAEDIMPKLYGTWIYNPNGRAFVCQITENVMTYTRSGWSTENIFYKIKSVEIDKTTGKHTIMLEYKDIGQDAPLQERLVYDPAAETLERYKRPTDNTEQPIKFTKSKL